MSVNGKETSTTTLKILNKTQQYTSTVIEESSENILTESTAFLNWWTENFSGLFNYKLHPDTSLLQSDQTPTQEAESLPLLREEVEQGCALPESWKVCMSEQHSLRAA